MSTFAAQFERIPPLPMSPHEFRERVGRGGKAASFNPDAGSFLQAISDDVALFCKTSL